MNKIVLMLCALMPAMAYSADLQSIAKVLIKFADRPGTYRIKVESVNKIQEVSRDDIRYDSLSESIYSYTQEVEGDRFWLITTIPGEAIRIRISIRKFENGRCVAGGFGFFKLDGLHELAEKAKTQQERNYICNCTIDLSNNFKNFCERNAQARIGVGSIENDEITE